MKRRDCGGVGNGEEPVRTPGQANVPFRTRKTSVLRYERRPPDRGRLCPLFKIHLPNQGKRMASCFMISRSLCRRHLLRSQEHEGRRRDAPVPASGFDRVEQSLKAWLQHRAAFSLMSDEVAGGICRRSNRAGIKDFIHGNLYPRSSRPFVGSELRHLCQKSMPPAGVDCAASFLTFSATMASVVTNRPATEAASWSAVRTTLAGSITPCA